MPTITFAFQDNVTRVYLEDGSTAVIPLGTRATVTPTILEAKEYVDSYQRMVPLGDGGELIPRQYYREEFIKLDHLIHDSSHGPLRFSSLLEPDVIWNLIYVHHCTNWRDLGSLGADLGLGTRSLPITPVLFRQVGDAALPHLMPRT